MPKVLRVIDVKPQNEKIIDVLPKNVQALDISPKMAKITGELTQGYSVTISSGQYMGLPWLINSTVGTVTQWSEVG